MNKLQILITLSLLFLATVNCQCNIPDQDKLDCGFLGINQQQCESKGCCWKQASQVKRLLLGDSNAGAPFCYYKSDTCGQLNFSANETGFTQDFYNKMYQNFDNNIDLYGLGGIVAAPDNSTPGGSYWYHWMRDAGLTMRHYIELNDKDLSKIQKKMNDYTQWIIAAQSQPDPNNIDIRVEPKFYLNSRKPFEGGWCRPQTDGPAISAVALMMYANILLDKGQSDYVKQYLWTSGSYNGGAIRYDLEWVNAYWGQDGCDLWEELRSNDFFWNRMSFRYAMQMASEFATRMGEQSTSQKYASTAAAIMATLDGHYTGQFFQQSSNRQRDSAVIHAFASFDGFFSQTDGRIARTIRTYNMLFCLQNPINQQDTKNGIPGILYGRYEGDNYAGGNPWQLLTAVLGELFYREAAAMIEDNEDMNKQLPQEFVSAWKSLLSLKDNASVGDFVKGAKQAGDSVLKRVYYHVAGDNGRIDEQLNKNTGFQMSAKGLTWSYANILGALHYRNTTLLPAMQQKGLDN